MKIVYFIVIGLCLLIVVGYTISGPFMVIPKIRSGIIDRDPENLAENIDFPTLRTNLKEQFNYAIMKSAAPALKKNPLTSLRMAFVQKLTESEVDSLVTSSGLANLNGGPEAQRSRGAVITAFSAISEQLTDKIQNTNSNEKPQPLRKMRYTFDGLSKVSAWVKNGKYAEIRFILTRDGLSWKLSNIIVPTMVFEENKSTTQSEWGAIQEADKLLGNNRNAQPRPGSIQDADNFLKGSIGKSRSWMNTTQEIDKLFMDTNKPPTQTRNPQNTEKLLDSNSQ